MEGYVTIEQIEEAADTFRSQLTELPTVAMILGSGLGPVADAIEAEAIVPHEEVPHYPRSTVQGHLGRSVVGQLEGHVVMAIQGRFHFYEGYSMAQVTLPIRVMQVLGVKTLILTNAAGGMSPEFEAGDVMILRDHINLVGMAGLNPLRGPNLERFGPRFPDMSRVYDQELREMAKKVAEEADVPIHEGVYICLAGPSFETPADLRFLRGVGVDAVGMSTVPEATVARHGGMRVLGMSGISNVALMEEAVASGDQETTHEEVLEAGKLLAPRMEAIIRGVLKQL
jgi:purine-nucleoside phosphorylase